MPVRRHDPPRPRGIVLITLQQREGRLTHPSGNITRIRDNAPRHTASSARARPPDDPDAGRLVGERLVRGDVRIGEADALPARPGRLTGNAPTTTVPMIMTRPRRRSATACARAASPTTTSTTPRPTRISTSSDAHDNMTAMPHIDVLRWYAEDRMQSTDRGGGDGGARRGPPDAGAGAAGGERGGAGGAGAPCRRSRCTGRSRRARTRR